MNKTSTLICATIALSLASATMAGEKLPDFLNKVQLHNFDGYELTPDGAGVSVYRLPAEVREHLSEAGARIMVFSQSGEIRFVLKEGAKLQDVMIRLKSNRNTVISFYRGDELCGATTLIAKKGVEPYIPPSLVGKTSSDQYPDRACEIDLKPAKLKLSPRAAKAAEGPRPAKRFAEQVYRVVLDKGVITLTGIEGDIRPPKPEELPPVLVSYGTSISMGASAKKPEGSFPALTAAAFGYSLRNLGCSGSAFCEKEMADYLAKQPGDLFLFEISVNMVGKRTKAGSGFEVDEFRKRAAYLVDAVAKAHPKSPVVCISILPYEADKHEEQAVKPGQFRKALEEICRATPHKNVHFVDGTKLLSFEGLDPRDKIHPTDAGHAEIATKLIPQIRKVLGQDLMIPPTVMADGFQVVGDSSLRGSVAQNGQAITRAIFSMDGFCVWDPSLVKDATGKYHLFYSRWPLRHGFEAWVTHSEVCRATAETPYGPFRFAEVVLPKRPGHWDGDVTHNPSIRRFGERYYLYYNGNQSEGGWWDHRNNQRVGVAVADRPEGPWTRFDKPLLDVTPGAWDAKVTTNPSCAQTPDGRYILIYKGVGDRLPPPKFGPVLHGVAFAGRPTGPFVKHPEPIFAAQGAEFPGEDPFVWCEKGHYFALIKDMGTFYAPASRSIVRFDSADGIHWKPSPSPVFQERMLVHQDGRREEVHRLERPFLYETDDRQKVFYCGVKPRADRAESIIAVITHNP